MHGWGEMGWGSVGKGLIRLLWALWCRLGMVAGMMPSCQVDGLLLRVATGLALPGGDLVWLMWASCCTSQPSAQQTCS